MFSLQPPRHISTLPLATDIAVKENVRCWGNGDRAVSMCGAAASCSIAINVC